MKRIFFAFVFILLIISCKESNEELIERAITYNPNSPFADEVARSQVPYNDALYQRVQILCEMDSIESSYKDFRQLIAENYEKSNCLLWQGVLWLKGGDKQKACEKFTQAKESAIEQEDKNEAQRFIETYCSK